LQSGFLVALIVQRRRLPPRALRRCVPKPAVDRIVPPSHAIWDCGPGDVKNGQCPDERPHSKIAAGICTDHRFPPIRYSAGSSLQPARPPFTGAEPHPGGRAAIRRRAAAPRAPPDGTWNDGCSAQTALVTRSRAQSPPRRMGVVLDITPQRTRPSRNSCACDIAMTGALSAAVKSGEGHGRDLPRGLIIAGARVDSHAPLIAVMGPRRGRPRTSSAAQARAISIMRISSRHLDDNGTASEITSG